MATFWFNKGREGFADGSFSWTGSEIRFALIDNTKYNPGSGSSDKFLSTPAAISGAIVARTAAGAGSKDATDGILDCADPTWSSVTAGTTVGAWIAYVQTGSDATARMICFVDNSGGLPFTGNGGDVTLQLDNGANKLGKL
jgi:hypothetical protein